MPTATNPAEYTEEMIVESYIALCDTRPRVGDTVTIRLGFTALDGKEAQVVDVTHDGFTDSGVMVRTPLRTRGVWLRYSECKLVRMSRARTEGILSDIAADMIDHAVSGGKYDGCSTAMELAYPEYVERARRVLTEAGEAP